jgi:hypothetical protein
MSPLAVFAVCLVAVIVAANVAVSVAVARSGYYSRAQKMGQIAIVWLLPFVGALAVGVFLYSQRDNPMFNTRAYPEPSEKAVPHTWEQEVREHARPD